MRRCVLLDDASAVVVSCTTQLDLSKLVIFGISNLSSHVYFSTIPPIFFSASS